jgi:uncharacterized membrane protein SpoIIM required for sporulation
MSIYFAFFRKKGIVIGFFLCVFVVSYFSYVGTFILSEIALDMRIKEFASEEYQPKNLTPEQNNMIAYQIGDGGRKIFHLYFGWFPPLIWAFLSYMIAKIVEMLFKKRCKGFYCA